MGDFAAAQLIDAVHALLRRDRARAQRVIDHGRELDALRRDVSSTAAAVIAKRPPMAADLDEILADLRVAEDLERVGDLAKSTARRAVVVAAFVLPEDITDQLQHLGEAASSQLRAALVAYTLRDAAQALATREQDEALDRLYTEVFREIVTRVTGDQPQVVGLIHLLFCAKNIERVGDRAARIAETTYVLATGGSPVSERQRRDENSTMVSDSCAGPLVPRS